MAAPGPLKQLLDALQRDSLLTLADTCDILLSQRRERSTIRSELGSKLANITTDKLLIGLGSLQRPVLLTVCQKLAIPVDQTARKQVFVEELRNFLATARASSPAVSTESGRGVPKKVFVVHGHDSAMRNDVVRFLNSAGLDPIILAEQANGGSTIIEKLEENMAECSRAVILFSPDDVGHARSQVESEKTPRARQNVVFEFGMAVGMLGRKNVIFLYRKPVEIPTDIAGIVYIQYQEDNHHYKVLLARELKKMGFDIDLNQVL